MTARLACLRCGYLLDAGPGTPPASGRCPECGRPFDPDDLTTCAVRLEHPERLERFDLEPVAESVRARLAAEGIRAAQESGTRGVTGFGERRVHWLFVEASDLERAREVLRRLATEGREPGWECAACGEQVPPSFEICWACGAERP